MGKNDEKDESAKDTRGNKKSSLPFFLGAQKLEILPYGCKKKPKNFNREKRKLDKSEVSKLLTNHD